MPQRNILGPTLWTLTLQHRVKLGELRRDALSLRELGSNTRAHWAAAGNSLVVLVRAEPNEERRHAPIFHTHPHAQFFNKRCARCCDFIACRRRATR